MTNTEVLLNVLVIAKTSLLFVVIICDTVSTLTNNNFLFKNPSQFDFSIYLCCVYLCVWLIFAVTHGDYQTNYISKSTTNNTFISH